jgi:hypothetical protein
MNSNQELNKIENKETAMIRDHWVQEVMALDLLNGVDQKSASSIDTLSDRFLIFDRESPKSLDS